MEHQFEVVRKKLDRKVEEIAVLKGKVAVTVLGSGARGKSLIRGFCLLNGCFCAGGRVLFCT